MKLAPVTIIASLVFMALAYLEPHAAIVVVPVYLAVVCYAHGGIVRERRRRQGLA